MFSLVEMLLHHDLNPEYRRNASKVTHRPKKFCGDAPSAAAHERAKFSRWHEFRTG